jgi:RNA polymerase sigma-70 factor (ECF subfamily)
MEDIPEERLVSLARGGDTAAFTELARRCHARIYGMMLNMIRNPQDADDLVQESFLQAYRAIGRFRGRSSFFTWIYRIAVNLAINFLRKAGREKNRVDVEPDLCSDGAGSGKSMSSPENLSLQREFRRKLKEAIGRLPLVYRSAFELVEFQGLSHRQAARVLKCSENTVSWRMHRARRKLQESLEPFWERGIS